MFRLANPRRPPASIPQSVTGGSYPKAGESHSIDRPPFGRPDRRSSSSRHFDSDAALRRRVRRGGQDAGHHPAHRVPLQDRVRSRRPHSRAHLHQEGRVGAAAEDQRPSQRLLRRGEGDRWHLPFGCFGAAAGVVARPPEPSACPARIQAWFDHSAPIRTHESPGRPGGRGSEGHRVGESTRRHP